MHKQTHGMCTHLQAFHRVDFRAGDTIIRQGEKSDNMEFYVLESGIADISIEGKGSVMKATRVRLQRLQRLQRIQRLHW